MIASKTVMLAEKLLLDKFKQEPFHNLYQLNDIEPLTTRYGGTCSDKTLSYLEAAKTAGLGAFLHSARIGGKEIHRLVRLEIAGQRYFADIGNGWPSIKLFSATEPVAYKCYGMGFRTEIEDGVITVYHCKCGVEKEQMIIDISEKPEHAIQQSIARRFSSNIDYPFGNELRFSMIVGERFLFLRGRRLEIYDGSGFVEFADISLDHLRKDIWKYFGFDIGVIGQCRATGATV